MSDLLGKFVELLRENPALAWFCAALPIILFISREVIRAFRQIRELDLERFKIIRKVHVLQDQGFPEHAEGEGEAGRVIGFNFRLLERYYEQHLVEYKLMARSCLVIAFLGFGVILIGVFFALSDKISIGIVTGIAGMIAEAAAALFFRQNKELINQVQDYHKKLVSTQYLLTSISLASELPEPGRLIQRERIIGNLLFLSNELHGSSSEHLFRTAGAGRRPAGVSIKQPAHLRPATGDSQVAGSGLISQPANGTQRPLLQDHVAPTASATKANETSAENTAADGAALGD